MSQSVRLGFFCALAAYIIWGLLPLYFKALLHIDPVLMLAHRILWSLPTGLLLLAAAGALPELKAAWNRKMAAWLTVSAILIASNWLVYIWAVGENRVLEASLGYYINPLVNVAIGAVFLGEALRRKQWAAVALATIGVIVMTIALNAVPIVALFLCFSFGGYALIRKFLLIDGRAGFVVEAAILFPLALIWVVRYANAGGAVWGNGTPRDIGLLVLSGPLTAVPLILFALAAKRLTFATVGMMQYIGPTLQFILATLVFREAFQLTQGVAFAFIWAALFVFSYDSLKSRGPQAA